MLIALLGGGLEITNYVLIHQKVERTSATISDLVAQSVRMTKGQMTSLFSATEHVMKPFDLATEGNIVVSSITGTNGKAIISWQQSSGKGDNGSRFGMQGADATQALCRRIEGDRRRQDYRPARWREHHRLRGLLPLPADAVR